MPALADTPPSQETSPTTHEEGAILNGPVKLQNIQIVRFILGF